MSATVAGVLQLSLVVFLLAAAYVPLGDYMARVYTGTKNLGVERMLYRVARVDPDRGQTWAGYALAVVAFSAVSILFLYVLQRVQQWLPMSGGHSSIDPATAFNTAVSFVTNTNWQSYSPEAVMANLTQMVGLAVQNFVSAAVGIAVAIALIRGITSRGEKTLGNFWVDLVRGCLRILLPIAAIITIIFLTQGAVQSLRSGFDFTGLDGLAHRSVVGPFASQEAIKLLGTNGGGTLSANSAHPFSNPTPLTNVVQVLAVLLIPVCLTRTYGTLVRDQRQGLTLLGVMASLYAIILTITWTAEAHATGIAGTAAGAMLEGKEQRFGIAGTALFAVSTTGTSTGGVNSAHDSFSPLGGGAVLWNMLLGEVAPGGVGTGLYGLLVLAVIAIFVGGLLVGRTPMFAGKQIGRGEITVAVLSVLVMPMLVLTGTGLSMLVGSIPNALGNYGDPGTPGRIHGFSEVLYAFASASNNNGSAFGGLTATSDWYQTSLGLAMLFGRLLPIIVTLALAGLLAAQRPRETASTAALPTHGSLYGGLLTGTVVLVSGLTFFPAMALGPIAEALA